MVVEKVPDVRFARASGSSIAYQVYGDGPVTICAVPPMAQNIELAWESPVIRRMFERYATFSRQVVFDKRGTGMSDRSLDIPAIDERVDELSAVMDAAEIDRAFLHGVSEGGPMTLMFAATYPDRVEGVILEGTGATLIDDGARATRFSGPEYEQQLERWEAYAAAWGTPESMSLDIFGPSLAADPEVRTWWPRYERQCANQDALIKLLKMNGDMDVRDILHRVDAPVLIVHRTGDRIVSIEQARETYRLLDEAGADVRMVELPGDDHFTFAGDLDAVADEIEQFTTGAVRARAPRRSVRPVITTMGRFDVEVGGEPVRTSAWGSKRARTLLKRLVVARGWPVTRDEMIDLLWPDDDSDRLGARLSVQLSAVRRILHGGVVADRSSIRLDLDAVDVDLERWFALDDDGSVVEQFAGDLLPDDRYDDWTGALRDEVRSRFVSAARRAAVGAEPDRAIELYRQVLTADPYDETSHRSLIAVLHADGRLGDAHTAHAAYAAAMDELGVGADDWSAVVGGR